jgi:hypothetical protein
MSDGSFGINAIPEFGGTGLLTGDGLLEALLDKRFEPSSAK